MRKWLITSIISVTCLGWMQAQNSSPEVITFDEALQRVMLNNEVIKQSQLRNSQMEHELKAVRTLRLPQVSLNANYIMLSDDITIDMHGIKDAITPLYGALSTYGNFSGVPNPDPATSAVMPVLPDNISTQAVRNQLSEGLEKVENGEWDKLIQKNQFATLSAGVSWPIFTGGKINAANRAAEIRIREASEEERQKIGLLYSELVERYYGLVLAKEAESVRNQVFGAMQNHLSDAEKLFDEGMLARAELLHAKVFHAQADRELKMSARQRVVINEALGNTLAANQQATYTPLSPLFYLEEIESVDFFKIQALTASPLLNQVNAKHDLAKQGVVVERSALMPTVAAFGNYNIANIDLTPNASDYMVGLTLSWKIFGGTTARHKYKSARYLQAQVEQVQNKASRDIEMGIEKYHQELHMVLEQLQELETAGNFAEEYYRIRQQAFAEGIATSTEVVDASLAVAKVKIERLQAAYQFNVTLAKLLELSGIPEQFTTYRNSPSAIIVGG